MTFTEALMKLIEIYDPESTMIRTARRKNGSANVCFHLDEDAKIVFMVGAFSEMDGFYAECECWPTSEDLLANDWQIR